MRRLLPILFCSLFTQLSFAQNCVVSITASDNVLTCTNTVTLTIPSLDGFQYKWYKDKRIISGETDTSYTVTEPGLYEVVMNNFNDPDAVPCVTSDGIDITQSLNDYPINIGVDTAICANDSLTLRSNKVATSYLWSTGETTREIVFRPSQQVNTESITLFVSNNGCQGTDTIAIETKATPVVNFPTDTIVCGSSNLVLDVTTANSTYLWSDNSANPILEIEDAGTYWVFVDNGQCSESDTVEVSFVAPPTADLGNDISLCIGDDVTFNALPGFTTTWSTGQSGQDITFTATTAGSFDIWLKLETGTCEDADTVTITVKETPIVDLGDDLAACDGTEFTLDARGNTGVTYLWSDNSTADTLQVNQTGQYWVKVDNGTCADEDTIEVNLVPIPVADLGNDITLCIGDTLPLGDANQSLTTTWSTGATSPNINFIANTTGAFDVWMKLENAYCSDIDTLTITVRDLPVVNLGDDRNGCEGGTFALDAENTGASYKWSDDSEAQILEVDKSGLYWVEVNDDFCVNKDSVEVTIHPQPVVNLGDDISLCEGKTFDLDAGNTASSFEYTWSTGSKDQLITVDYTMTAPISVVVSNDFCSDTGEVNFTFFSLPVVDLGADQEVCKGTEVTLDAGAFSSYTWTKASESQAIGTGQTFKFIAEEIDTYSLTVTDANGCEGRGEVSISQIFELPEVYLGLDVEICENSAATFDAGSGFSKYTWQDNSNKQTFDAEAIGTYTVQVEDGNGCVNSDEVRVTKINALPKPIIPDAQLDCDTEEVFIDAGNFDAYLWEDGSTDAERLITKEGTYSVIVTDIKGCQKEASVVITDPCDYMITFPNAFVASSSAKNPIFLPVYTRIVEYNLFIFDRWGKVIYHSQNIDEGWDGTINGTDQLPIGSYLYKAVYVGKRKGELVTDETQGSVFLVR